MKILRLIIIIVLGTMLSSCWDYYRKVSHLSDEELEWVNCYNIGDTVLFQSDRGTINKLLVQEKNIYNSRCPFYIRYYGERQRKFYYAGADCRFIIIGPEIRGAKEHSYRGYFAIKKLIENDTIMRWGYLNERYSKEWPLSIGAEIEIYDSLNHAKIQNIEYNGTILSDCIVYDDKNSHTPFVFYESPYNIESYTISKKYGLISYKLKNGEVFTRVMDNAQL